MRTPLIIRRVVGDSMHPTLPAGVIIVAMRRGLQVGSVVVLRHQGRDKIKRIAALRHTTLFVTGDNPGASTDSRSFGWIPRGQVLGTVIWPLRTRQRDGPKG